MTTPPIQTRPPTESESLLKQKFTESIVTQSELMDKLAQQLITLELAIPGLYATVLKLVGGDKATLSPTPVLIFGFVCWGLSLALTLASLFPREWNVNTDLLRGRSSEEDGQMGIEDFFYESARHKRCFLVSACLSFFAGTICTISAMLSP